VCPSKFHFGSLIPQPNSAGRWGLLGGVWVTGAEPHEWINAFLKEINRLAIVEVQPHFLTCTCSVFLLSTMN
jgi:hypothetical protein